MRQFGFAHLRSTRISSPAAQDSRSASATRNALARASAATSPDPDHGMAISLRSDRTPRLALSRVGRNRVRPGLVPELTRQLGAQQRQRRIRMRRPAGRGRRALNSSKVTMVETGLPGNAKKNFSFTRLRQNTSGCPGQSARDRKRNRAPRSASTRSTTSYLPADTPPR